MKKRRLTPIDNAEPVKSSQAIAAEITALDEAAAARADALAEMAAVRHDLLATGDIDQLQEHDTRGRRLALEGEVAAVRRAQLVVVLDEAQTAEEQGKRRAAYTAGELALSEGEALVSEYAKAAKVIADILARLAAAKATVAAANAALPEGAQPIPDPEHERSAPAEMMKPRKLTGVKRRWVEDEHTRKQAIVETPWTSDDPSWRQPAPTPSLVASVVLPGVSYGAAAIHRGGDA